MLNSGLSRIEHTSLTPLQTIDTLRENAKWTTGHRA